jgi:hypothetical protein
MRPFSSGSSPSYIKIHKGILNTKNFIYDVCYGIYKHVVFAPGKAERPRSLPVIKWISPLRELLQLLTLKNKRNFTSIRTATTFFKNQQELTY